MKIGEDQGEKRNQEEGTSDTGSETTPATAIVTSLSQESVSTSQVNLNYALISNGKCTSCFDGKAENRSLSCWECTRLFHALCLKEDGETEKLGKDIICSSTFYDSFVKASKKEGVYATRRGNFTFVCDACKVDKGKTSAAAKSDKFTLLDNKIDAVNNSLLLELKELKRMLKTPEKTDTVTPQSVNSLNTDYNVWNDKQRTKNLAQIVSVHKDKEGKPISSEKLEKICVENGVSVNRTFHMKKSDTTGMVLNSQHDVDVLTASLKHAHHPVVKISTRVPTVHIVGLSKEYTKEELKAMIVKQNHGISTLFECASTSSEDKLIDILAVKPLKNNSLIFKAIVKVSNVIRSILAIQKNKVYIGFQSMCKVYDSIFVLRCYKCQGYGHHSDECKNDKLCGLCCGDHETKSCDKSTDDQDFKCCNCVKANNDETNHHAGDPRCPVFVEHQNRIKRTIPFYQSN